MAFAKRKTGGGESFPLAKWDGRVGTPKTASRTSAANGTASRTTSPTGSLPR